jgi:hypothetical protein
MQNQTRTSVQKIQVRADVLIERVITKDSFDGSPWPPEGDGWRMVRELDDWRHEWRRISIEENI